MSTAQTVYPLLADLVVWGHLAFVLWVVLGGLLVAKWPRFIWIHLTAVLWAAIIECSGWICPLTPLENWLRHKGGEEGYRSDFVARYILPMLYPEGLTRRTQIALGAFVIVVNLAIYSWAFRTSKRVKHS
ncbi:MAG: DUF2784 family protein [Deltaproteobacteria bacterium]|nr:DUF2784 family protein [Deltaproteobacteria bacterium]